MGTFSAGGRAAPLLRLLKAPGNRGLLLFQGITLLPEEGPRGQGGEGQNREVNDIAFLEISRLLGRTGGWQNKPPVTKKPEIIEETRVTGG